MMMSKRAIKGEWIKLKDKNFIITFKYRFSDDRNTIYVSYYNYESTDNIHVLKSPISMRVHIVQTFSANFFKNLFFNI